MAHDKKNFAKVEISHELAPQILVKIEKRAAAAGVSVSAMINAILDDAVAHDHWTREDETRSRALIDANFQK